MKLKNTVTLLTFFLTLQFFSGSAVASEKYSFLEGRIILTGSSTVAPLINEIGKRFEALNKGVRVDVQTGGSSRGINDVRSGTANIGMVSRGLKPVELNLKSYTIAKDGICIILHKSNPVSSLSERQIVDIYRGKIRNWKDVGGRDDGIMVVNKASGRSTLELFLKHFRLKNRNVKAHVIIGDNEQGIKTVSGDPNAIGYVSIGSAEYNVKNNAPIQLLPIEGVEASIEKVASGKFPLSRPLNLVTRGGETNLEKAFIEFAQSSQVHDIVKKQYFVPVL